MAYNIFEKWPFTSYQNLNLDWILKSMQNISGSIQSAVDAAISAQRDAAAAASAAVEASGSAAAAQQTAGEALQVANSKISMPTVTAEQAGYFARVNSSGVWIAEAVPAAEEVSF